MVKPEQEDISRDNICKNKALNITELMNPLLFIVLAELRVVQLSGVLLFLMGYHFL